MNSSTLETLIYGALPVSKNEDGIKELLAHFSGSESDERDLDNFKKSWGKSLLESKAFGKKNIEPKEFSTSLIKDLTTKYNDILDSAKETKVLSTVENSGSDISNLMKSYWKMEDIDNATNDTLSKLCHVRVWDRNIRTISDDERHLLLRKNNKV